MGLYSAAIESSSLRSTCCRPHGRDGPRDAIWTYSNVSPPHDDPTISSAARGKHGCKRSTRCSTRRVGATNQSAAGCRRITGRPLAHAARLSARHTCTRLLHHAVPLAPAQTGCQTGEHEGTRLQRLACAVGIDCTTAATQMERASCSKAPTACGKSPHPWRTWRYMPEGSNTCIVGQSPVGERRARPSPEAGEGAPGMRGGRGCARRGTPNGAQMLNG